MEIEAVLGAWALKRALVLPANPSQGRVVRAGQYFVQGQPIHETEFRNDPRYPRRTADVRVLAGPRGSAPVHLCRAGDVLPRSGIVLGDAECVDDLRSWAARVEDDTLCVGGVDFFRALLEKAGWKPNPHLRLTSVGSDTKSVFVCGTASSGKTTLMQTAAARGVPLARLPPELFSGAGDSTTMLEEWVQRILTSLAVAGSVVLVIDQPPIQDAARARQAADFLVQGAWRLLREGAARRFLVEGGATASALLQRLGWRRLEVEGELSPGIVCLTEPSAGSLRLIVKPGSYTWPPAAWPGG